MLPILLIVVNNIEQVVEPESCPQSGVTMLNNIVDIIEQCGQHNIVESIVFNNLLQLIIFGRVIILKPFFSQRFVVSVELLHVWRARAVFIHEKIIKNEGVRL